jgi:uncharacterized protein (TIGR02246 family)
LHLLFARAVQVGDLDAVMALYEPNATFVPLPGQLVTGHAAIREALRGMFALRPRFELDPRESIVAGDIALLISRWKISGTRLDGRPLHLEGQTSDVARRQEDGTWLLVIDNPYSGSGGTSSGLGAHPEPGHPDRDSRVRHLPPLTETERQPLIEWNATAADYPKDRCVHQLVEAQVERTPGNVAAIFGTEELTYHELNRRANQVAHHLRRYGIGPEVRVGIVMERSLDAVVAVLGVLKAGGAYVPLDPADPEAWRVSLLHDAEVRIVLGKGSAAAGSPIGGAGVVWVDGSPHTFAHESEQNLASRTCPENLAYVMYTSGSTGQPKGVMIEHRSLVNYLFWVNRVLLGENIRTIPLASRLTFDACLKQLFAPLLRGDAVWILPVDVATQPAALLEMLGRQSAVGLNCIPSFWSVILDEIRLGGARAPAESLTALILGGEQATPDLVTGSFAAIPNLKIWNVYGPTEATGNASAGIATLDDGVPIGRPIANTQLYVLDRRFNPVPVGVPGELYIGGDGLARGYLKRTELTAEAFLPNPFSERPGARLYRTGDRVRWRPDGQLQFLGRLDEQVKIRGFRVEPGEIEAVLAQHPDVRQAAVVARANASGQNLLAAYVVSARSQATTEHRLNRFLRQRLPDYMIPSRFVALDTLPRLPNGKVNRKALPSPQEAGLHLPRASAPPRTPVEETLTVIWVEVFGDQVGVHDNFFELGGHSLQGTQLVARIRRRLGVDLPIRVLFESPTIAELGAWLDALEERVGVP